jgi:hypothetical protein
MSITGPVGLPGALTAVHALEAAAEFIIGRGCWLHRDDFTSRFVTAGPDSSDPGTMLASIDWEAAITALDAGELPCSGGNAAPCAWRPASPPEPRSASATR